jgi:hypothetical protein
MRTTVELLAWHFRTEFAYDRALETLSALIRDLAFV